MVGSCWVLGDQLASRPSSTRLSYQLGSRRQVVGLVGYEAGGKARGGRPREMVEQGGGGRYRWLRVRKAEHEASSRLWVDCQTINAETAHGRHGDKIKEKDINLKFLV